MNEARFNAWGRTTTERATKSQGRLVSPERIWIIFINSSGKKKWLTYAVTVLLVNCHDVTGRIFDRWTSRQTGMKVTLKWHNQPGKKRTFYKVLMEKRTEGRKVKTTHNTCRDCRVHFFWQPFSSKYLYSGNSILKGPRDWRNLFAIMRLRYIKVLFHIFYYYWGKLIAKQDFVIQRFVISRFHCIWGKVIPARRWPCRANFLFLV